MNAKTFAGIVVVSSVIGYGLGKLILRSMPDQFSVGKRTFVRKAK